jgi:hypothetical protein
MQFLLINAFDYLAISGFLYLLINFRDRRRRGGLSYPPGPPSSPVIGNLHDVPKETPWIAYVDMSKKYGKRNTFGNTGPPRLSTASQGSDIICLRVYSRFIVVLCSLSAIKDLLEQRGKNYSFRHPPPISEMYVL